MQLGLKRKWSDMMEYLRAAESLQPLVFVAAAATLFSYLVINVAFYVVAQQFEPFRNARTDFAFTFPIRNPFMFIICLVEGIIILENKKWLIPLVVGSVCFAFLIPMYAASGPIDQVLPLIELRINLLEYALLLNTVTVVLWNASAKRAARANPAEPGCWHNGEPYKAASMAARISSLRRNPTK